MSERLYHLAALSLIIAWMLLWPLSWFGLPSPPWGAVGVATAVGAGALLTTTKVGAWTFAILGHLSFALVMVIAAWLLARLGFAFPPTPPWAKIVYLLASLLFYLSVASLIRFDVYALLYRPVARAILSLTLIAYCLVAGDVFVAVTVAGALALTQAKIGASNLLDHLHHGLIIIVVFVSLVS